MSDHWNLPSPNMLRDGVLTDVARERDRQEEIGRTKREAGSDWRSCADPAMVGGDGVRTLVLGEEFGEVCKAVLEGDRGLRAELVQVAAVAVAWVEKIDRERMSSSSLPARHGKPAA